MYNSRVLNKSNFYLRSYYYFENTKSYILSNLVYKLSNYIIKLYAKKDTIKNIDSISKFHFNSILSSTRVKIEYTFSLIKTRFSILE
jgi:hypothetical protein